MLVPEPTTDRRLCASGTSTNGVFPGALRPGSLRPAVLPPSLSRKRELSRKSVRPRSLYRLRSVALSSPAVQPAPPPAHTTSTERISIAPRLTRVGP